jgi:hypothetical protein
MDSAFLVDAWIGHQLPVLVPFNEPRTAFNHRIARSDAYPFLLYAGDIVSD